MAYFLRCGHQSGGESSNGSYNSLVSDTFAMRRRR